MRQPHRLVSLQFSWDHHLLAQTSLQVTSKTGLVSWELGSISEKVFSSAFHLLEDTDCQVCVWRWPAITSITFLLIITISHGTNCHLNPLYQETLLLLYVPSVQSSSCTWLAQRHNFTIDALGLQSPLSAAFDLSNTVHLRNLEKKGNTISQAQLAAFLDCHAAASKWNFELKIVSLKDSVAKINEQFDNLKREQIRLVSLANPPIASPYPTVSLPSYADLSPSTACPPLPLSRLYCS